MRLGDLRKNRWYHLGFKKSTLWKRPENNDFQMLYKLLAFQQSLFGVLFVMWWITFCFLHEGVERLRLEPSNVYRYRYAYYWAMNKKLMVCIYVRDYTPISSSTDVGLSVRKSRMQRMRWVCKTIRDNSRFCRPEIPRSEINWKKHKKRIWILFDWQRGLVHFPYINPPHLHYINPSVVFRVFFQRPFPRPTGVCLLRLGKLPQVVRQEFLPTCAGRLKKTSCWECIPFGLSWMVNFRAIFFWRKHSCFWRGTKETCKCIISGSSMLDFEKLETR